MSTSHVSFAVSASTHSATGTEARNTTGVTIAPSTSGRFCRSGRGGG